MKRSYRLGIAEVCQADRTAYPIGSGHFEARFAVRRS
jgi:hypothetical protein